MDQSDKSLSKVRSTKNTSSKRPTESVKEQKKINQPALERRGKLLVYVGPTAGLDSVEAIEAVRREYEGEK